MFSNLIESLKKQSPQMLQHYTFYISITLQLFREDHPNAEGDTKDSKQKCQVHKTGYLQFLLDSNNQANKAHKVQAKYKSKKMGK